MLKPQHILTIVSLIFIYSGGGGTFGSTCRLLSQDDYQFSKPKCKNYISGNVIGTSDVPDTNQYYKARVEDIAFINESVIERNWLANIPDWDEHYADTPNQYQLITDSQGRKYSSNAVDQPQIKEKHFIIPEITRYYSTNSLHLITDPILILTNSADGGGWRETIDGKNYFYLGVRSSLYGCANACGDKTDTIKYMKRTYTTPDSYIDQIIKTKITRKKTLIDMCFKENTGDKSDQTLPLYGDTLLYNMNGRNIQEEFPDKVNFSHVVSNNTTYLQNLIGEVYFHNLYKISDFTNTYKYFRYNTFLVEDRFTSGDNVRYDMNSDIEHENELDVQDLELDEEGVVIDKNTNYVHNIRYEPDHSTLLFEVNGNRVLWNQYNLWENESGIILPYLHFWHIQHHWDRYFKQQYAISFKLCPTYNKNWAWENIFVYPKIKCIYPFILVSVSYYSKSTQRYIINDWNTGITETNTVYFNQPRSYEIILVPLPKIDGRGLRTSTIFPSNLTANVQISQDAMWDKICKASLLATNISFNIKSRLPPLYFPLPDEKPPIDDSLTSFSVNQTYTEFKFKADILRCFMFYEIHPSTYLPSWEKPE